MAYTIDSHVRAVRDLTDKAGVTIPKDTPGVVKSIIKTDVYSVKFTSWPVEFVCVGSDLVPDGPVGLTSILRKPSSSKKPPTIPTKKTAKKAASAKKATKKKATTKKATKKKPRG